MKGTSEFLRRAAAVTVFAAAAAVTAVSGQQQQAPTPPRPETDPARMEADRRRMERERREREMDLRIVETESTRRRADAPEPRLDVEQIVEDFKLLQVVSRDLAQAASAGDVLDFKAVTKSASEIRKRASRLSSNLALPKSEKGRKRTTTEDLSDPEELRRTLTTLDTLIDEFAHNPVFRDVNLVDAELSAKARRDLDGIIELSERVRKSSERLGRAAASR